jgi:hypothetical protein
VADRGFARLDNFDGNMGSAMANAGQVPDHLSWEFLNNVTKEPETAQMKRAHL